MTLPSEKRMRDAVADDGSQLLRLWGLLFDGADLGEQQLWKSNALAWFARVVGDSNVARLPVVEVDDTIVATAIGTLELGVPNPHCARGRTVRLANLITLPGHRGRGYATLLVREVIAWARAIDADRVDLSATQEAQRIYEKAGFVVTSAPRMKLALQSA